MISSLETSAVGGVDWRLLRALAIILYLGQATARVHG